MRLVSRCVCANNSFKPTAGVGQLIKQPSRAGGGLILVLEVVLKSPGKMPISPHGQTLSGICFGVLSAAFFVVWTTFSAHNPGAHSSGYALPALFGVSSVISFSLAAAIFLGKSPGKLLRLLPITVSVMGYAVLVLAHNP